MVCIVWCVAVQHERCGVATSGWGTDPVPSDAWRCQNPASLPEGMDEVEREPSYA